MRERYQISAAVHEATWLWCRDVGLPLTTVFAGTNIGIKDIDDHGFTIDPDAHNRMLHNVVAASSGKLPGLGIGLRTRLDQLGILGVMMESAPTIAGALAAGARFAQAGGLLGEARFITDGEESKIHFTPPAEQPLLKRFLVENLFAAVIVFLRQLQGQEPAPANGANQSPVLRVCFPYPAVRNVAAYRETFGANQIFNSEKAELVIRPEVSEAVPIRSNPLTYAQCLEPCQNLVRAMRVHEPLLTEVSDILRKDLSRLPDLVSVAADMGISPRTLQRKLAAAGTTFGAILNMIRRDQAQALLANRSLRIEDVAEMTGYSDAANFRRAVNRWTGMSPSQYRQDLEKEYWA